MTLEIETISTKRYLLISLLSVPCIIGICITLSLIFDLGLYIILILPLLIAIFIISKKFASQKISLEIGNDRVSINKRTIDFSTIKGYHINKTGLLMSSLDLRLTSDETVSITCSNFGEQSIKFTQITEMLVKAIEGENQDFKPMNYQDVHVKQMKFLRPMIISGITIVLILDILAILIRISGGKWLPWQVLMVNIVIFSLLPYLKKNKTNKTP
jgi:hypothetical protein